jgi:multiple sugar transport system permease protein
MSSTGNLTARRPRPAQIRRHAVPLHRRSGRLLTYGILVTAVILITIPVLWLVLSSLKTNVEYNAYPVQIFPTTWRWRNYYSAVTAGKGLDRSPQEQALGWQTYLGALQRSLILTAISTIPGVITSAMVGFGFARHHAPGRDLLFKIMIAMLMIPSFSTTIPQYVLYNYLRLVGTYWPWLFGAIGSNVFFTFMFRQFFAGFPKELEDAAEIDGSSRLRVFWQIFMPNAGPVIAACTIFSFQGNWGDWFSPVLFLKANQWTMATLLAGAYADPMGNPRVVETMAAVVLFIIPSVVAFFFGQRQIQQSVVTSGLK